jgi:diketogulonate reductase-like aldo/keto reductase
MVTQKIRLNTGAEIPVVGLGVYQSARGRETRDAVRIAIERGYRHVDTARIYGNEADVGAAIKESGVPRAEIFVTTKLWNTDQGHDGALRAFDESNKRLGLEYVDLYLIHWPVPGKRLDSWRAMEKLHREGRAKAIGVSNFMVQHLEELLASAEIVPAVNQIELSPFLQQREVDALCKARGIAVEAYSPLTRGLKLRHPAVLAIAETLGRTPAQVLLRWSLERGWITLPKSVHEPRIVENAALFDFALDDAQRAKLDGLEEGLVTGWDPRGQP